MDRAIGFEPIGWGIVSLHLLFWFQARLLGSIKAHIAGMQHVWVELLLVFLDSYMFQLLCVTFGTYWSTAGTFAMLDYIFEQLDLLPKVKYSQRRTINWHLYGAASKNALYNQIVVLLPMATVVEVLAARYVLFLHDVSWAGGIYRLIIGIVLVDFLFFVTHRFLHHPYMFQRFHKQHHLLVEPIAAGAVCASKLENALVNLLPVLLVPFMMDFNRNCMFVWFALANFSAVLNHSGYRLPFVKFHDDHHRYTKCNFGVIGLCDWFWGTLHIDDDTQCSLIQNCSGIVISWFQ